MLHLTCIKGHCVMAIHPEHWRSVLCPCSTEPWWSSCSQQRKQRAASCFIHCSKKGCSSPLNAIYRKAGLGVMAWRRWQVTKVGGAPVYPNTPALDPFRDSLGKLRRRELLDRTKHTQHCATCSKALGQDRTAKKGVCRACRHNLPDLHRSVG
ncbi:hypothetical protein COCOBI_01-4530 [Coccomyxa sp. Obi]|nr:hypothetical protein COCOBI_01-4530 [Coccomyxa sp. Obi]